MTNWKILIEDMFTLTGDSWDQVESNTMTENEMMIDFDDGYGSIEGIPFTVWTKNYIYFPVSYDGSEWVGCVSRNPNGEPSYHFGGD